MALTAAVLRRRWRLPSAATVAPVRELRVCADPNNLPFSNARGEGFENRIADMVAHDLGTHVELHLVGAARAASSATRSRRASATS